MLTPAAAPAIKAIAAEVITSLASHQPIAPFSSRPGGLTLDDACRVTPLLRAAFEARGEKILGRKIGFTNRNIWAQYGVYAPIWGYVTDATVQELNAPSPPFRDGPQGRTRNPETNSVPVSGFRVRSLRERPGMTGEISTARMADFAEPRIEPEIMFGLKAAPAPDMDESALLDCIEWVSLGYEIVQSLFPSWKFAPADTVAANALHGALFVGHHRAVAPRKAEWLRELATFQADLYCNGKLIDRGGGAAVLDSPLSALRHLVTMLAKDPHNPPIAADEIISTGTLTKAMPVAAGEIWTTKVSGIPFEEISLRFE